MTFQWAIAVLAITCFFVWLAYEAQREKMRRLQHEAAELNKKVESIPTLVSHHVKEAEEKFSKDITELKLEVARLKRQQ
jgi:uncharacterized membrane protein (DUF106 family)